MARSVSRSSISFWSRRNISRAAGAQHGQLVRQEDLEGLVAPLGRTLEQRTTLYGRVERGHRLTVTREDDGRTLIPLVSA